MFKQLSFKKRIFLLLGLLSFASIAFIASNLRPSDIKPLPTPTPSSQITSDIPQMSRLKPNNFSYASAVTFPFPANLPVYQTVKPTPVYLDTVFKQIINRYKFVPSPTSKNYYYSADKTIILLFDSQNQYITYSVDGTKKPSAYVGNNPPRLTAALNIAQKFLNQFPEYQNLEPQSDLISYSIVGNIGSQPVKTTDSAKADIITIPYTNFISGYPYRYSSSTASPSIISIGQNNQITRAYFSAQPLPQIASPKNYPLLSSDQILSALNNGQGSVIYAPLYNLPTNTTDLPTTIITKINIEYRYDTNRNLLLPYYWILGQLLPHPEATIPIEIQILLPAVKL